MGGVNVCFQREREREKAREQFHNFIMSENEYTGCPKKEECLIFVTLIFENIALFDFIR